MHTPSDKPAERIGMYASMVRSELAGAVGPRTYRDLKDALRVSDRILLAALDRLEFTGELVIGTRLEPHRRGASPRVYSLKK
jgi:hypothetical protein